MDKIKQKNKVKKEGAKTHYLDTLALLDHHPPKSKGKIDQISALKTLKKRANYKWRTYQIIFHLIDYAELIQDDWWKDSYWDSFHCVDTIIQGDGKYKAEYCKKRWCVVCNNIRTGILTNQYKPKLEAWRDPQFLTLTKPKVHAKYVEENYKLMVKSFSNAWRRTKRKHGNTEAIRKTETTWKKAKKKHLIDRDFHTHFHILLDGKEFAETLRLEWMKEYPSCNPKAQLNKPADENSYAELFKYMTKLWKSKEILPYPVYAHHTIFEAMRNKRIIQCYGGLKPYEEDFENDVATINTEDLRNEIFKWEQEIKDWVSGSGELLVENLK